MQTRAMEPEFQQGDAQKELKRQERLERLRAELREKAKTDPEFSRQMEAALYIMEKYHDTLQRLADS